MAEVSNEDSSKMFGPLSFEEYEIEKYNPSLEHECLLCDSKFSFKDRLDVFLKHLFEDHNLVIEDVQNIERIDKYVVFWKKRFIETAIETIIPSVKIDGTSRNYFVLSNLIQEDKQIRHQNKLESALERQEEERSKTNFKRSCLFCKFDFEGTCVDYVKHLSTQHNLQLGKAENLVYIREFLDVIEEKINGNFIPKILQTENKGFKLTLLEASEIQNQVKLKKDVINEIQEVYKSLLIGL